MAACRPWACLAAALPVGLAAALPVARAACAQRTALATLTCIRAAAARVVIPPNTNATTRSRRSFP